MVMLSLNGDNNKNDDGDKNVVDNNHRLYTDDDVDGRHTDNNDDDVFDDRW